MSEVTTATVAERKAAALAKTRANVQKGRSSKTGTYLSMFVELLNGKDEETGMTRIEIISDISFDILDAQYELEGGLDLDNPEHDEAFTKMNEKVKAQVAAAISNSQNNTSLSFNPNTKDKYELQHNDAPVAQRLYWIVEK